jgi:hypothetical protein
MRIAATLVLALVGGLPMAGQTEACKRPVSRGELAAHWLAAHPRFDAVVQVEVASVALAPRGGWRATGRRFRTLEGSDAPAEVEFGDAELVVSSCGLPYDTPVVGQAWVLYLVRSGTTTWEAKVFLPADLQVGGSLSDAPMPMSLPPVGEIVPTPPITPRR